MAASPLASILQGPPDPFQNLWDMAGGPNATPMPGALSAEGTSRNTDDLQVDSPQGALSAADGQTQFDKYGQDLLDYGGGPLAQANTLRDARAQAIQKKREALETAKARIKELDRQMPDPNRAWGLGIGAPTRTGRFTEAMSNAAMMRQGALDERRAAAKDIAQQLNTIDIAQAGLGWDEAQAEAQAQEQRQNLAREFFTQGRLADQNREAIQYRMLQQRQLDEYRQDQIRQRELDRESREAFTTYDGVDEETGLPVYRNRLGETRLGDRKIAPKPTAAGNTLTQTQKDAAYYVRIKLAPDEATAVQMLRQGKDSPAVFARLVQGEKNAIMEDERGISEAEAERRATENVRSRIRASGTPIGEPTNANTATNPGFKTNFPMTPGSGAPRPGAAKSAAAGRLPPNVTAAEARRQAAEQIAAGRDRKSVLERLGAWGVDTSGF